ncbi:protein THEM6 [Xylocopa sonorina]|uniref:protein THEM6 n=1 Tax=Xylocopa sonorina TaxID=1818115 RepID=UPI00403A9596
MVCTCLVTFALLLYILFDVNYFIRIICIIGLGRLMGKKSKVLDTVTTYGICTTQDIDFVLRHMNNARYLRELDFARFLFYDRNGIYSLVLKKGGNAVQGAVSIRYRRSIPIFTPFKIVTKVLYWEDRHVYLQHEFINLFDGFVYTVAMAKQTVTGLPVSMAELIAEVDPTAQRPELTKDAQLWIDSMQESSQKYKKQS